MAMAREIHDGSLLDESGRPCGAVSSGERITIRGAPFSIICAPSRWSAPHPQPNRHGCLRHPHEDRADRSLTVRCRRRTEIDFNFDCWLTPHQYTVTVATQYFDGSSHDWLDDVITFHVLSRRQAASKNPADFYEFAVRIVCIRRTILKDSGSPLVPEVKMEGSHSNNRVQLPDMACGAITRICAQALRPKSAPVPSP